MILKEAFRYQNFLSNLINHALTYFSTRDNVVVRTQEHMRHVANPEAENETIVVPRATDFEFTPNDIIDFLVHVLEEKDNLTKKISAAKRMAEIDMDSSISMNKSYQLVAQRLGALTLMKSGERTFTERAQKFNANGEAVWYNYNVKEVATIDFDRNKAKALSKKFSKMADETSMQVDKLNVELEVDFSPAYDIGDTLEDCVAKFKK